MSTNALETQAVQSSGAVSRFKNTRRVWVNPDQFQETAVTGSWALEESSNVSSLATDDAGTTNIFLVPLNAEFSDAAIEGGGVATDRGIRVMGLELHYTVAASALASIDLTIYSVVVASDGVYTATAVTDTTSFDTAGDDGTETDSHRMEVFIAKADRNFMDNDRLYYARLAVTDGTSSDVNIRGATWHLERVEE